MANFIEELYYDNIEPQARGYNKGSSVVKVSDDINELEEKLSQRLNDEEKNSFSISAIPMPR